MGESRVVFRVLVWKPEGKRGDPGVDGRIILRWIFRKCGPGSSVGKTTGYGMDGPWIESRWGRDFPHLCRPALGPTQPPVQLGTGSFPGVESGRGVTLIPHPLLVPRSKYRVELYLYSP
jgi:hypothetical protein